MGELVWWSYSICTRRRRSFLALVERAAQGEEIIIARNGKPAARLLPIGPRLERRQLGSMRDQIIMSDDFDAPLPPELLAAFGMNA